MAKSRITRHKGTPDIRESDILKTILEFLAWRKIPAWRNNSGAFGGVHINRQGQAKKWFVRFGKKGSSDILGVLPPNGKIIAIEVKKPGKHATSDQSVFLEEVRESGGLAGVCTDIEDVKDLLNIE
jgi:hypothetical protein